MTQYIPTREEAYELLTKYTKTDSLIKHALAVEATMRHFAKLFGEDEEKWGIIGLIHDLDFEEYPDQHCTMTKKILEEENWPQDYIRGVLAHGWKLTEAGVEPKEKMEKVIYTVDELTGLISATALMRPSKSLLDLQTKSVRKKWKDKKFAAGVNREVVQEGVDLLEMDLNDVIKETIEGMRTVAEELDLKGNL